MTLCWLLWACASSPTPDGGSTSTDPSSDAGTGDGGTADGGTADGGVDDWVSPELLQPVDAEDLDPAEGAVSVELRAAAWSHSIEGPAGTMEIEGWAYNGSTPGPTIRAQVGDTVTVSLENALGVETTIHWHGLHVPWDMDGVTWMQEPIAAGDRFTYSFTVDQAGTSWYHPHFDTDRQVDLGLYGALVVTDPTQPPATVDAVLVLDDWRPGYSFDDTGVDLSDADQAHGQQGDEGLWTINGLHQPTLSVDAGASVRLRLINASNTGYIDLRQDGLRVLAHDQGLLTAADPADGLLLAPGDRAEIELMVGSDSIELWDAPYNHQGGEGFGDDALLLTVEPIGSAEAPPPLALSWAKGAVSADPGRTDVVYVFAGDPSTGDWFINGEQYPDVTVQQLELDQLAVIEVRNISPTEHPFHLHGHAFEVLSMDGVPPATRQLEDTVNLPLYGTARLLLLANNPGDWMAHCHILPHADGGMMSVLRVGEGG